MVTDRDARRLLDPDDTCSKTRRLMIDILQEKWLAARIPNDDAFYEHPDAEECLETMPIFCYKDNVAKRAVHLTGGAGPWGIEWNMLRNWILFHEL